MNFWQIFSPSAILVDWGIIKIHWYGLLVVLGIIAGYLVAYGLWKASGREPKKFESLVWWLVIFGLIGARVVDVFIFEWDFFKDNWWSILWVWQGGLAIHGALLAGVLVIWRYVKKYQDNLWQLLDIFAPAVVLGQAIGRWGNYFNQELFGLPTKLPWGIYIKSEFRPTEYILTEQFHPVFLYESLALFVVFWILLKIYKKTYQPGTVFLIYLLLAGITRFILEFIRLDEQVLVLGVRSGMLIASIIMLISIILLLQRFYLNKIKIIIGDK
ncbi:MAG: prolipoprotein diacylglyceryl transferase [Patescibacteria group bacterium]